MLLHRPKALKQHTAVQQTFIGWAVASIVELEKKFSTLIRN